MALFLRDFVGSILTPTPLIEIFLILGLILLFKKKTNGKYFLVTAFILFVVFGTNPFPEFLLNKTEMMYPAYQHQDKDIKFVVVLAGGIAPYKGHPITTQLTVPTLNRLIEGIKIYKEIPGSKLVVTGKGWAETSEAEMMKEVAVGLGVNPSDIIVEKESLNTFEHTQYLKAIIQNDKFVLVTSALHLPRAMHLFLATGYKPIPAPSHHILTGEYQLFNMRFPFTTGDNLAAMDEWFKEFWATKWAEVRGQI